MIKVLENSADFEQIIKDSTVPVVVDFNAKWCGTCKMMTPILEEISKDYGDKVVILMVDVDNHMSIAQGCNVTSLPTIAIYHNNNVCDLIVGAVPKPEITKKLDRILQEV